MIEKVVLRDQVRQFLQKEMLKRNIAFGERLSLADIARQIDVSVTPIREALTQLEQAGIVTTIANRGFFVPRLSVQEAREIYPIIISLESMAVEQSLYSSRQLKRLHAVQADFEKAGNEEEAVKLDLRFHKILLENYENRIANRILDDLKVRVFFYELDYMSYGRHHQSSLGCHRQIIKCLETNNISNAVTLVRKNWEASLEFLVAYYSSKNSPTNV